MLVHRIALTAALAVLAAPSAAFATNADGATPTATPLLVEIAVAAMVAGGLLARRRISGFARAAASRVASRQPARRARVIER